MLTFADILKPRHVDLSLGGGDADAAAGTLSELLQGDPRVRNWNAFDAVLKRHGIVALNAISCSAAICHSRGDDVASMLMAAGRVAPGGPPLHLPAAAAAASDGLPAADVEMRFLFLVGVPLAMASDYLRIVGALARILKNPAAVAALEAAVKPEDFVAVLAEHELRM